MQQPAKSYGAVYLSAAVIAVVFAAALLGFTPNANIALNPVAKVPFDVSLRPIIVAYEQACINIGILLFLSAFACQLGGWTSARFGPEKPLAIAYVTCAIGWWIAIHTASSSIFLVALVPAVFALQFSFPILLAFCGSLDEQGQWTGIATPLLTSGFAWASISAGQIFSYWGMSALATATALGMLLCLGLLIMTHLTKSATEI